MPAQQYLLEALGIEPPADGEAVVPVRRSQDERWSTSIAAARQFHARERHLRPARKHVEVTNANGSGEGAERRTQAGRPRSAVGRRLMGIQHRAVAGRRPLSDSRGADLGV
ncbi:hypothetical protein ACFYXC_29145 [Streptomyces sp. NPDC002701]|uniref:hypothetical protein n=1 Tax=Streptomyces sp. NPDC002701 TaxID=3364661 RepID=UPI00367A316C